jgi:hypothetical protein
VLIKFFSTFFRRIAWPGALAFGLTLGLYVLLFSRRVLLDVTAQVQTLEKVCAGEVALPPIAMFYGLTWLVALGQCQFLYLMGAAVIVLSACVLAKWWLTRDLLYDWTENQDKTWDWLALALCFVCSLPTWEWWTAGRYIIGQPSPNYWMNGTLLVSWPWAIILFGQSYRQLQAPKAGWWKWQMLWLGLLLLSKPSYAFIYVIVYPLFLLGRHGWRHRALWWHLLPLAALGLGIAIEYYLVFKQADSIYVREFNHGAQSGVGVRWAYVWSLWSACIPISILAGVAFPLVVAGLYWHELRQKLLFWYAWAGFGVALLISLTFVQHGEESYTWAFRFQHYIAAYLLYVVSAFFTWEKIRAADFCLTAKNRVLLALFCLHVISAFIYFVKFWYTKDHE